MSVTSSPVHHGAGIVGTAPIARMLADDARRAHRVGRAHVGDDPDAAPQRRRHDRLHALQQHRRVALGRVLGAIQRLARDGALGQAFHREIVEFAALDDLHAGGMRSSAKPAPQPILILSRAMAILVRIRDLSAHALASRSATAAWTLQLATVSPMLNAAREGVPAGDVVAQRRVECRRPPISSRSFLPIVRRSARTPSRTSGPRRPDSSGRTCRPPVRRRRRGRG